MPMTRQFTLFYPPSLSHPCSFSHKFCTTSLLTPIYFTPKFIHQILTLDLSYVPHSFLTPKRKIATNIILYNPFTTSKPFLLTHLFYPNFCPLCHTVFKLFPTPTIQLSRSLHLFSHCNQTHNLFNHHNYF